MLKTFFCALFCACLGGHINPGDTSNLNRLIRRADSVGGATLDRVGKVEKKDLKCFFSTDPGSVHVNHIYNDLEDEGFLWRGKPSSILSCADTSPPASPNCVPCLLDQAVCVICNGIAETVQLMMEAADKNFDNIKADCPSFTEPSGPKEQQEEQLPETEVPTDRQFPVSWAVPIIILGVIIAVFLIVCVYKRQAIKEFFKRRFCPPPAVDVDRPDENTPMNEV